MRLAWRTLPCAAFGALLACHDAQPPPAAGTPVGPAPAAEVAPSDAAVAAAPDGLQVEVGITYCIP
ncbi:MAG: hypothetical protein K0V04_21410 [Deltaproteobacteria bacterium]|nr:hypothetical protein [Deltaproteobacteria bacterium]